MTSENLLVVEEKIGSFLWIDSRCFYSAWSWTEGMDIII